MLTQARLKELFHYDPETGLFTRLISRSNRVKAGQVITRIDTAGYVSVEIGRISYRMHRLAHLYMIGTFPKEQMDHINGIRHDNRWANLRACSNRENCQNQAIKSKTGFRGCHKNSYGKWVAEIINNEVKYHLGIYETPEEAQGAYLQAKARLHTFNPTPRC